MLNELNMAYWNWWRKLVLRFFVLFIGLFVCSFSFPHTFLPDVGKWFSPFFEKLVVFCGDNVLHVKRPYTQRIISDSTGMYLDVLVVAVMSVVVSGVWSLTDKKQRNYDRLLYWFIVIVRYYLAMQLLHYGFNKVFKWQFYMPEPNTMYTTIGNTWPDMLYWSSMGVSRPYTVFSGLLEVIAACMLFFRRTSFAGALLAFAVMVNVVVINFSYDISVKVYSLFLVLLSMVVIAPEFGRVLSLVGASIRSGERERGARRWRGNLYIAVKLVVVWLIVVDNMWPYVKADNYNDDKAAKPFLYGAYEVTRFVKNGDTLAPLLTDGYRWKRVFVHSRGYFITQGMNDEMTDHKLSYDTVNRRLGLGEYGVKESVILNYVRYGDTALVLSGVYKGDSVWVATEKIDLTALPVRQGGFRWTIDE